MAKTKTKTDTAAATAANRKVKWVQDALEIGDLDWAEQFLASGIVLTEAQWQAGLVKSLRSQPIAALTSARKLAAKFGVVISPESISVAAIDAFESITANNLSKLIQVVKYFETELQALPLAGVFKLASTQSKEAKDSQALKTIFDVAEKLLGNSMNKPEREEYLRRLYTFPSEGHYLTKQDIEYNINILYDAKERGIRLQFLTQQNENHMDPWTVLQHTPVNDSSPAGDSTFLKLLRAIDDTSAFHVTRPVSLLDFRSLNKFTESLISAGAVNEFNVMVSRGIFSDSSDKYSTKFVEKTTEVIESLGKWHSSENNEHQLQRLLKFGVSCGLLSAANRLLLMLESIDKISVKGIGNKKSMAKARLETLAARDAFLVCFLYPGIQFEEAKIASEFNLREKHTVISRI